MKVVFLKKNNYINYNKSNLNGYKFNPRNRNINSLIIIKEDFINFILSKKIERDINKLKKTVNLIVCSDLAIEDDCNMMLDEVFKVTLKLDNKYKIYFDAFKYFEYVKDLYFLNNVINYKKRVINLNNE